jgi:hypothetical protein
MYWQGTGQYIEHFKTALSSVELFWFTTGSQGK